MIAGLLCCGCPSNEEYREFDEGDDVTNVTPVEEHAHEHGPHGGHIIELGEEEYHAEVVVDEARKLTVYLLGPDAATAAPIAAESIAFELGDLDAPTVLTLNAVPLEGEPEGQSSRFEAAADALPESVHDIEELHGAVVVDVGGLSYVGALSHDHDHGHDHDHDHGHAEGEAGHDH
jgi:hypothetical protein